MEDLERSPKTIHYKWTINNFSTLANNYARTESSLFPDEENEIRFRLILQNTSTKKTIFRLGKEGKIISTKKSSPYIKLIKFSIKSDDAFNTMRYPKRNCDIDDIQLLPIAIIRTRKLLDRQYLKDDTLSIYIRIFLVPKLESSVFKSIENLVDSDKFFDFTISVGDKRLNVYKGILAERSSVFRTMFENSDFLENKTNVMEIKDIDFDILTDMVKFMYGGGIPSIQEKASDLLYAAEKYAFDELKLSCEKFLCRNICAENAAVMFEIGEQCNAFQLRTGAWEFIRQNYLKIMNTEGWKQLVKKTPDLLEKVCRYLAETYQSK